MGHYQRAGVLIAVLGGVACGGATSAPRGPIGGAGDGVATWCDDAVPDLTAEELDGRAWKVLQGGGGQVAACEVAAPGEGRAAVTRDGAVVMEIDACGFLLRAAGHPVAMEGPTVGESLEAGLAAIAHAGDRLECSGREVAGETWCGLRRATDEYAYDPFVYYVVEADGAPVEGPAADALVAGKVVRGVAMSTRCD